MNYKGVSINTKNLKKNNLFFAIKGKKNDGHNFANIAIKKGAIKEVKDYTKLNLSPNPSYSANSIIGINEIGLFLEKTISMHELKEKVLIRTRQYAKRQFTWQRGQMQDWKGFDDTNYLDLRKKVIRYLSKT